VGALTELVPVEMGIGEVRLVLPALRQLCRAKRRVAFVDPPCTPHPLALHGQGLPSNGPFGLPPKPTQTGCGRRLSCCVSPASGAVLLWSRRPQDRDLDKLQLAAFTLWTVH